jgi:Uma2 family endonuclease
VISVLSSASILLAYDTSILLAYDISYQRSDKIMIVSLQNPTFTLEEFLKRPETKPASEYINGQVYQKSMPQGKHSRLQTRLPNELNSIIEPPRLGCAFTELRCTFGGRSLVPDVSVFRWERIPLDDNGSLQNVFEIAPDWTIEILSPDQNPSKVTSNILYCLDYGTQMGWLIDPDEKSVIAYPADARSRYFDQPEQILPVPEWATDLQLKLGDIFQTLQIEMG